MTDKPIFDFENSQVPQLKALENSYTNNDLEDGVKKIFIHLFKEHIGEESFNAFVSGVPHLGSFPLVQRFLNDDGLALLDSSMIEPATRYLYRTWKSGDVQKRGLHVVKIYMRLLFGDGAEVYQLQQPINEPYPTFLEQFDPLIGLLDEHFLTSRVNLDIDISMSTQPIKRITNSIQSVLPARFVPDLRFTNITTKFEMKTTLINWGQFSVHFFGEGYLIQKYFNNPDLSNSNFKHAHDYTMKMLLDGSGELDQSSSNTLEGIKRFKSASKPKMTAFWSGIGYIGKED